jgi:hypothetical protein
MVKRPRLPRNLSEIIDEAMPEEEVWARIAAIARGEVIVPRVKIAGQLMERDPVVPRISDVVQCLGMMVEHKRGKATVRVDVSTPDSVRALSDGELRARAEAILARLDSAPAIDAEFTALPAAPSERVTAALPAPDPTPNRP